MGDLRSKKLGGVIDLRPAWSWVVLSLFSGAVVGIVAAAVSPVIYLVVLFPVLVGIAGGLVSRSLIQPGSYPRNLPAVWDKYWGYLVKENVAPVLIGEFGTRYDTEKDKQWLSEFQKYIKQNHLSWTCRSLNPNSGDTGGLHQDDWTSIHQVKQSILRQIQYPFIGPYVYYQAR